MGHAKRLLIFFQLDEAQKVTSGVTSQEVSGEVSVSGEAGVSGAAGVLELTPNTASGARPRRPAPKKVCWKYVLYEM